MTWRSRILALFPVLHLFGSLMLIVATLHAQSAEALWFYSALFLFVLYLLPPLFFRIHVLICPLHEGIVALTSKGPSKYNAWWGTHQFQMLFIAFPLLESALRLIPGAYSAWLRLWGAKVGRRVYWTPRVEILDRSLLQIGDDVVFGHESALCSHIVTPAKNGLRLYVGKVTIGHGCLIGGRCELAPGVVVADGVRLAYATRSEIGQQFTDGKSCDK